MNEREILAAWRTEVGRLAHTCVVALEPPHWPPPSGSDPYDALDVRAANRALARGCTVERAAEVLAARRLARSIGLGAVRDALAVELSRPSYVVRLPARWQRESGNIAGLRSA